MKLRITPSPVSGTVAAPPSKSYTHRAIILGALAEGETVIENYLDSDDTRYTINACRALGVNIEASREILRISGTGGHFPCRLQPQTVFVGNSGSTIRMAAALAALAPSRIIFDGEARLRERPVKDLLHALKSLGIKAGSIDKDGYPPIEIWGGRLKGGAVQVSGETSSQHISALLMVAPYAENSLIIKVVDKLKSRPYVAITIDIMGKFGVAVENQNYKEFTVRSGQKYRGIKYRVEGDYSSAAYFFAAGAIGKKAVTVSNLAPGSAQGDRYFLEILSQMGCIIKPEKEGVTVWREGELTGIDVNMGDYPDIVQPLTVVAAYAGERSRIKGIGHLKYKETDRIRNTANELGKMGINVMARDDIMIIEGGKPRGADIEAYNDHRMAMSFAVAGLFAEGETIINGAESVSKSYPDFFNDLKRIGAKVAEF